MGESYLSTKFSSMKALIRFLVAKSCKKVPDFGRVLYSYLSTKFSIMRALIKFLEAKSCKKVPDFGGVLSMKVLFVTPRVTPPVTPPVTPRVINPCFTSLVLRTTVV